MKLYKRKICDRIKVYLQNKTIDNNKQKKLLIFKEDFTVFLIILKVLLMSKSF